MSKLRNILFYTLIFFLVWVITYTLDRAVFNPSVRWSKLFEYKRNFVITEEGVCKTSKSLRVIICVHSAPHNFVRRQAIRETWGATEIKPFSFFKDVKIVFVLGISKIQKYNEFVRKESKINRDIIQCDFLDDIKDLTVKSVCMLWWVTKHCFNAKLLFKCDDDIYVNVNNLVLLSHSLPRRKTIFGLMIRDSRPIRDPRDALYVSKIVYPYSRYPDYVQGFSYYVTVDAVSKLLGGCNDTFYVNIEDVFITGLCAENAGISRLNVSGFPLQLCNPNICDYRNNVAVRSVNLEDMLVIHRSLYNLSVLC